MNTSSTSKFKLSICIPTYNRIEFLPQTLNSILQQYKPEVQIVISDNCSTDGTKDWINKFIAKNPNCHIKYFCFDENMGADYNYMNVIKLADGDYCWFLGSDDVITEGSLDIILHKILLNYNVLLFCRLNCDIKLQPKKIEYILKKGISERTYLLSNRNDLLQYFKDAVDLAATFSYLSVIVVKKSAWDNTPFDISFLGSAYSHVYRLLIMLRKEGTLYYSNRRVVMLRMGNDSFETEKKIERFVLDLNGYQKLGDSIFYDDDLLKYYFWGVLRKTHSWRTLFKARLSVATRKEWSQVENKLINLCFSKTKLFVVRKSYIIIQLIVKIKAL